MSAVSNRERLTVPASLQQQLRAFRTRVWSTQILAALALAVAGVLLAFLVVFLLDRFGDTPRPIRLAIFCIALALWLTLPWALYRWVWSHRRLDQLARLLRVRQASIGDQLLSVIELAESDYEQSRSPTLCAAAFVQVAEAARHRDLNAAAPPSHIIRWCVVVICSAIVAAALGIVAPGAVRNAWTRTVSPWSDTPRYTFTTVDELPARLIIAHGEATPLLVQLRDSSQWHPADAKLEIVGLPAMKSQRQTATYTFEIPPQTEPAEARLRVGDYSQSIQIVPTLRPALIAADAAVKLPVYLQREQTILRDARGGTLSIVSGSTVRVSATASRTLQAAAINAEPAKIEDATFQSGEIVVRDEANNLQLTWRDQYGLAGLEPFNLAIEPIPDENPSVASQQLPRQAVLLDSEQVNFNALAADDFGVKRIGMSWQGLDETLKAKPAQGERVIAAGGPDQGSIQSAATFSASSLGITAQPIELRLWAEDYMPGRKRVFSPPHIFYILTPDQHAIWITDQLSKWQQAALDVRDREMQLHAANKRLREATPEEIANEELGKELIAQAAAENDNGHKLSGLSKSGENLLRQAARNPEIGVGHLDRWAEMLQVINDISANRMPSVSDLLTAAATQPRPSPAGSPKPSAPSAGKDRHSASGAGQPAEEKVAATKQPIIPTISDRESSLQPDSGQPADEDAAPKKKNNGTRLGLPNTTLAGPAKAGEKEGTPEQPADEPEEEAIDQALFEQEELLAEFERIAEEMNAVLAELEGSTFVKRLKAASRGQNEVADRISSRIAGIFGRRSISAAADTELISKLSEVQHSGSQAVSYIMDDMQSYYERKRMNQFKFVLEDMRSSEVVSALRNIGDDLPKEQGMAIAQTEYWADTLDRWAEDLVDPAGGGSCPGSKNSDALPPSVILEVLQILEGEMNLREATRVAEQAKAASSSEVHRRESTELGQTQTELGERTKKVVRRISELPEGAARFGKDIDLLISVASVMTEASSILSNYETGAPAIAAETEAIELLLACKRINPKGGGGGGGSDPGGGGEGSTQDSALALLGTGLNQNEQRELRDVSQATGDTGRALPEEFRAGLDQYFHRLESGF